MSEDFKEKGESKIALDTYFQAERREGEKLLDFCIRNGWEEYIYQMLVVDYLILNRDRHGANIELPENADPWEIPLLLSSFAKKGEKTVNSYWSKMWVRQRIVPTDRQNLGQILKENGLYEYDEYSLLMLGEGRCAQDSYYLVSIDENTLRQRFCERYEKRIEDVVPLQHNSLLVFFKNGKVKRCDIGEIKTEDRFFKPILSFEEIFQRVTVQIGGYGVCWGENLMISDAELYEKGMEVPLSMEDFVSFLNNRVVSTAEATELLDCSRQNINDLVARGKLHPVKTEQKNKFFLKSEIMQRLWK